MMNDCYWCIKFFINGFETVAILYGDEQDLVRYLRDSFGDSLYTYKLISDQFAKQMFSIGFKVYMIPKSKEIPTEPEIKN